MNYTLLHTLERLGHSDLLERYYDRIVVAIMPEETLIFDPASYTDDELYEAVMRGAM